MSIVKFTQFANEIKDIVFKEPVKNAAGANMVYISSAQNGKIRIQLEDESGAACTAPFGVSSFDKNGINPCRKNLELSIHNPALVTFFKNLDEHIVQTAIKNKKTWFKYLKKDVSDETIRSMYYPIMSIGQEGKYPPRVHTKINVLHPEPEKTPDYIVPATIMQYFEEEHEYSPGSESDIIKSCSVMPITDLKGVWFQTHQWGGMLETTAIMVRKYKENEFPFLMEGPPPKKRTKTATTTNTSISVEKDTTDATINPFVLAAKKPSDESSGTSVLFENKNVKI